MVRLEWRVELVAVFWFEPNDLCASLTHPVLECEMITAHPCCSQDPTEAACAGEGFGT